MTKRDERLLELNDQLHWSSNIWMGVSVESQDTMHRIDCLKQTNAKIKFLSCEPLLEALPKLPLQGLDWVIVGGESGQKSREMEKDWVVDIKKQCDNHKVAFFFKQWGGRNKKKNGRLLNGKTYDDMPSLSARESGTTHKLNARESEMLCNSKSETIASIINRKWIYSINRFLY